MESAWSTSQRNGNGEWQEVERWEYATEEKTYTGSRYIHAKKSTTRAAMGEKRMDYKVPSTSSVTFNDPSGIGKEGLHFKKLLSM